jgi:hypothetical protein
MIAERMGVDLSVQSGFFMSCKEVRRAWKIVIFFIIS